MSEKTRLDRCCNPWKSSNEVGHIGKDLRNISKTIKRQFPHLPENGKICSNCRKKSKTDSMSAYLNISNDKTNDSMEEDKIIYESQDMDVSARKSDVKSVREIELEEMLTELKEKYNSLEGNDPLKLKILTIAPSSWSVNKIAKLLRLVKPYCRLPLRKSKHFMIVTVIAELCLDKMIAYL